MKMLFVANEGLATALKRSLAEYFDVSEITAIDFCHPNHKQAVQELANALNQTLRTDSQAEFLILADTFASTAYNETKILLETADLQKRSLIITGMNLPLAIKYFGLKDSLSLKTLTELQTEPETAIPMLAAS